MTTDLALLLRVAERVYASGVCPPDHKNADMTFAVMLAGAELGIGPMQAIRSIQIVKGKLSNTADFTIALCVRSQHCEYFRLVSGDATAAHYETRRRGAPAPTSLTYTLAQATRAGLTGSQTWRAHPEAMLRARCAAALARAVYPDLVAGIYTPDEAEEIRGADARPAATEEGDEDARREREAIQSECEPPREGSPMARLTLGLTAVEHLSDASKLWRELGQALNTAGVASDAKALLSAHLVARGYYLTAANTTAVLAGTMPDALRAVFDGLAVLSPTSPVEDAAAVLRDLRAQLSEHDRPEATRAAVRRLEALGFEDAKAKLGAILAPKGDGPKGGAKIPAAPQTTTANGSAAASSQGDGATALVSPEVTRWREHLAAKAPRGDDKGAAAIAGAYWKHCTGEGELAALPAAQRSLAYSAVLDELTARGISEPHSYLEEIGVKNGARRAA